MSKNLTTTFSSERFPSIMTINILYQYRPYSRQLIIYSINKGVIYSDSVQQRLQLLRRQRRR